MPMSEKAMENVIDQAPVAIISSVDSDGFPNTKAMLPPRKRNGLKEFYFTTNTSSMRVRSIGTTIKRVYIFIIKDITRE